jgi:hypothetical protein
MLNCIFILAPPLEKLSGCNLLTKSYSRHIMAAFPGFTSVTTPYKKIGEHEILAGILIPENLGAGKHPVIVRFHGGFLVSNFISPTLLLWMC